MTPEEEEWITDYGGLLNMLGAAEQSVRRALAKTSEHLPAALQAPGRFRPCLTRGSSRT